MIEESFSPKPVNFKALDAELRQNLGEAYNALMVSDSTIRVFLNEDVSRMTVQGIVDAHDPMQLTAEQQAQLDATAAVEAAREAHSSKLDLAQFLGESLPVQELATYVAWLELEIRNLRGL
jgi:hypothetical protein